MEGHLVEKHSDLEKQPDEAPWTIQQTFLGIFVTLVPLILFSVGLNSLGGKPTHTTPLPPMVDLVNAFVTFIFSSLIEGVFLIAALYFGNRPLRSIPGHLRLTLQALGFRSFRAGTAFTWIMVLLFATLGGSVLYGFLISVLHLHLQTNGQVILTAAKNIPFTVYALLIVAVFVAPFCEEVFFRGFVFTGLCRGMPLGWAIVISALIFAVAHGDVGSFLLLFIIGLALAFLRWRTKSLWPGIVLHMLNNAIAALAIVLAMQGVIKGV